MITKKPIKSAERALAVFEHFADVQTTLKVSELAVGMGMPVSSASALLKSLVQLGYLDYDPQRRTYYPSMRITLLGTWMSRRHSVIGRIPTLMSNLVNTTRESALIATRNGIYAQYVLVQLSPDPLRLDVRSGMLKPLACTAAGWSLLMTTSDAEIGKIVRRTQLEVTEPRWRESAGEAQQQIALARKRGYAQTMGHGTEGASAISVPIPPRGGHAPFSISVGGAIERVRRKEALIHDAIAELLREINREGADPFWAQNSPPPEPAPVAA